MERLAQSRNPETLQYWALAESTEDSPNWIAKWFLYHMFRYRDGRNRGGNHRVPNSGLQDRSRRLGITSQNLLVVPELESGSSSEGVSIVTMNGEIGQYPGRQWHGISGTNSITNKGTQK